MPTYEYFCTKCEKTTEAFQKITEAPLKKCPECHSETLQKGIGGGSAIFRFMGKGFYQTDYKGECKQNSCCDSKESCSHKSSQ